MVHPPQYTTYVSLLIPPLPNSQHLLVVPNPMETLNPFSLKQATNRIHLPSSTLPTLPGSIVGSQGNIPVCPRVQFCAPQTHEQEEREDLFRGKWWLMDPLSNCGLDWMIGIIHSIVDYHDLFIVCLEHQLLRK
jgi:hypothetical protein